MSADEQDFNEQERQRKMLRRILQLLEEQNSSAGERNTGWLTDEQLKAQLGISTRSLYRRRKDGTFKFCRIGCRYYYYVPDILKVRDHFIK